MVRGSEDERRAILGANLHVRRYDTRHRQGEKGYLVEVQLAVTISCEDVIAVLQLVHPSRASGFADNCSHGREARIVIATSVDRWQSRHQHDERGPGGDDVHILPRAG